MVAKFTEFISEE